MPPEQDEWTEEEKALKNALIDTLPKIPVRDKEGKIINNAQGDPVMTANPLYLDYTARLRQLRLARTQRQQALGAEQRQAAPVTRFSQRPFGGPFVGRYSQQRDPLTGAPVGQETFLGGEVDPEAIARDIAQQRASAPVSGDTVRQNPATGRWERVRQTRNPLTGEITETVLGEATPPLAFQQFQFQQSEAARNRKEAIDAAVAAETQGRLRSFTAEVARNRQDLYGSPFSVDPEQARARAINAQNAQQANTRLINVNNANAAALRIRDVARDPAKLQAMLQGMGPEGVARLKATLSQYSEDGSLDDVLEMLRVRGGAAFAIPPRPVFTRFAGVR